MILLETVAVACSMFSAIPMPQPEWNERNMRYALCAFPLIGVVNALLWFGWAALCELLALPALARAAGFCLIPVLVTGGIHLDGYADTSDALASYASPERRQEILKDSHCGAFAIIRLCIYFTAYFGVCGAFSSNGRDLLCAGLAFVLSRTMSGFSIATLPMAKHTGLAHTFATAAAKVRVRRMLGALAILLAAAICAVGRWGGAAMIAAAALVFWYYAHTAKKQFGGLSGDLAGWFLQKAEFWMLLALVSVRALEGLL